MTVSVRPGSEADLPAVARIWVDGWQVGYADIVPQPALDSLDPAQRRRQLLDRAADPADDSELLVATEGDAVAGFAVIGPWRGADGAPSGDGAGEIRAIYVAPSRWGRGVGRALMDRAVTRLDALGFAEQRLWVLADNDRARRFYESVGWQFDGNRQDYEIGGDTLPEVRYARRQHSAGVGVRPAGVADAGEIARLQLSTWRTAYDSVLPARVLDGLTHAEVAARWSAAVESPPSPRHRVLVALEQQWTVGFCAFGPAEDDGAVGSAITGLISTLLVEPRWGRRGHGSRLLAATVDLLRADGAGVAVTWLLERDQSSRSFYTSAGWQPDGALRHLDMDGRLVPELRLHASLAEAPDEPVKG
ncbi:MAG: GNAT family N-acetyltransferase [Pseudonocardiales bacterium]